MATRLLGLCMRELEDILIRDMLAASATQFYAVNGNNGDNPTNLDSADITNIVQILQANDAYFLSDLVDSEDKFGSSPLSRAYWTMAHSNMIGSLQALPDFAVVAQYSQQVVALRSEWGSVQNTRWLLSSLGSITPNASLLGNDIYNCFVTGQEGYGCVDLDGFAARFIYRDPLYNGPLGLNSTAGFVSYMAPVLLNDEWCGNLRTTIQV